MKTIELSQGEVAIVDDDDYDRINQHKWTVVKQGRNKYAIRTIRDEQGKRKRSYMHREILAAHQFIDHINRNGLDNRKQNLRPCTHKQNTYNRPKLRTSKSKYKGVQRANKKWRARITDKHGKKIHLGTYETPEQAALAYNEAALTIQGEFAYLNKIEDGNVGQ